MVKKILKHKPVFGLSVAALAFVLGGFFWAYSSLGSVSGVPLILHFSDLQGITQTGGLDLIVFMGVFGAIVVIMNSFIAMELVERDRFLGTLTASMTLLFAVLLFIAFVAILNVN
jgi:hypothetical protein